MNVAIEFSAWASGVEVDNPIPCDLESFISRVASGEWERQVAPIRELAHRLKSQPDDKPTEARLSALKQKLFSITASGTFSRRNSKSLIRHSGCIVADLDKLHDRCATVRETLLQSPHLVALMDSPTGTGLKVAFLVPPDPSLHQRSFEAVKKHVAALTGVAIDEACKDVARLCYASWDTNAVYRSDATVMPLLPIPARPKSNSGGHPIPDTTEERDRIDSALRSIPPEPRENWLTVGMSLHHWNQSSGRAIWDAWSSRAGDVFDPRDQNSTWAGFGNGHANPRTIASLFDLAKKNGWVYRKPRVKAPQPRRVPVVPTNPDTPSHHKSDAGYADLIINRFKGCLKYCPEESCWLTFTPENGWLRDTKGRLASMVVEFSRELYRAVMADQSLDPQSQIRKLKETVELGNKRRIEPALWVAATDPRVVVNATELDADAYSLGTENGVIDLRTGEFKPHAIDQLVTRRVACNFDPTATCPTWELFLARVQPDPEMRSFLQRLWGYSATGDNCDHFLPFHFGLGANGKGTALEQVLLRLFGTYAIKLTNSLVYASDRGLVPHLEIAALCGHRFALGEENPSGGKLNEPWLKSATGGDRQKGRFHYGNFFEHTPTYKIALVGNHKPVIDGTDEGIWRRFLLVDWPIHIPECERDPDLKNKLSRELPGILNWIIQGTRDWLVNGINPPPSCRASTAEFRTASDRLADFTSEGFEDHPTDSIPKADVFDAYKSWCHEEGVAHPLTRKALSTQLSNRGWISGRGTGAAREKRWLGKRKKPSLL